MISVIRHLVYFFIFHQCISITSPAPSSSNQDLDDILSIPSGNIRPGMLGRNHFDDYEEDIPEQDDILNTTKNVENTSKSMQENLVKKNEERWWQDTKKTGLIGGSGWISDRKRSHLLNLLQNFTYRL